MKSVTLKAARARRALTQVELSRLSGVELSIISRIERGVNPNPEYKTVVRLARALRVSQSELRFEDQVSA